MADRYTILDEIGKGGLGAVYKAFDNQLQREVAIKRVLTTEHATEEEVQSAARNLMGEAQTLSTLNHPNIVTVFDVGQDEDGGFVVMELLKGETLDDTVARGVLTQKDFVEVVHQTLEALMAAQAADLLHRDIKPTNVMVIWQPSGRFQIKILDFGLAKFTKTPRVQTSDQDDSVMGSIYFMAPEQFERGELDPRTDMYALGAVYYHALTGQYPFRGETAPAVMNAHLQHRVTPIEKLRPDLSPAIARWVMWLMNRKMENRPANAREALKRFPKHPDAPDKQTAKNLLQAVPVEESSAGTTTGVHVVPAPAHGAAPPTGLVVGQTTGVIGRPGPPPPAPAPGPPAGAALEEEVAPDVEPVPPRNRALKVTTLSILIVMILALGGSMLAKHLAESRRLEKLEAWSRQSDPQGTAADVSLAVGVLNGKHYSPDQKSQARKALLALQGPEIEPALIEELQGATNSASRMVLSQALAAHDTKRAAPVILDAVSRATGDPEKMEMLFAVRSLATAQIVPAVMKALDGRHSDQVRTMFEEIVLSVLRSEPLDDAVTRPLIDELSSAQGDKRRSLYTILGSLGGDSTLAYLQRIFDGDDIEAKKEAMIAMLRWPDWAALGILEDTIETTEDKVLKVAAIKAMARLVTMPDALAPEERQQAWRKVIGLSEAPRDLQMVFRAVTDFPTDDSRKLIGEFVEDPRRKQLAEYWIERLDEVKGKVKVAPPGKELQVSAENARGEGMGGGYDASAKAHVNWESPETWMVWLVKAREDGSYGFEVVQSYPNSAPSKFVLIVDEAELVGESKQTRSWEAYENVPVSGEVEMKADRIYTILLKAEQPMQPRMMNVRGIILKKR